MLLPISGEGSMKILGVDPSTSRTGYAIIDKSGLILYGSIAPKSSLSSPGKLLTIYNKINEVVIEYNPEIIICEDQFQRFANAVKAVSKVRGVIELIAGQHDIKFEYIEPKRVKKIFTNNGNATKNDMIVQAIKEFNVPPNINNDEADAIAVAYAYLKEAV
jgi:crossover junction endodeoxyribonuclease RuvC